MLRLHFHCSSRRIAPRFLRGARGLAFLGAFAVFFGPAALIRAQIADPGEPPRSGTVQDSDLTGITGKGPEAGKAEEALPEWKDREQETAAGTAPQTGPTIGGMPLERAGGSVGGEGEEGVFFPEIPFPLGPPPDEGDWLPEGALFPSGADLLQMMHPAITTLDATHAEISRPDADEQTKVSKALLELGLKIAPAVVTLRAWNQYGEELASGSGFFVTPSGTILTDMALIHPEITDEIDYISVTTGTGQGHRITGVWDRNTVSGSALLQSDAAETAFLKLNLEHQFDEPEAVTILAVSETRGLILADAVAKRDEKLSGKGWLVVRGQDSPGAVGSPVIDANGDVVAMIAMQLPIQEWVNFAVPIRDAAGNLDLETREPVAFAKLKSAEGEINLEGNVRFQRAYTDLYEGRYQRAAVTLVKLTKSHPRSAECWGLLGLANAQLGSWEEALDCHRRAVALDPALDESWYQLALASLQGADGMTLSPEATEALERAVEARPGDRFAWMLLAQSYLKAEDFEGADEALEEVVKLEPDYAQAHFLLGYVRLKRGDRAMAEAATRRSLELDNQNARAWFFLALMETERGNGEAAEEAFRAVVALDPNHPHAWLNLAHLLKTQGKQGEARKAYLEHQRATGG